MVQKQRKQSVEEPPFYASAKNQYLCEIIDVHFENMHAINEVTIFQVNK